MKAWGSFAAAGVEEKSVLGYDEDMLTLAAKAARRALETAGLAADRITRFAFASTTPPYGEKLLSSTLVANLGLPAGAFVSDHTTSTRAGTEALLTAAEHLAANPSGRALVAAADAPVASLWDSLDHGFGAGAVAFVLTAKPGIAELEGHASRVAEHFGERFRGREDDRLRDLGVRKFSEGSFLSETTGAGSALLKVLARPLAEFTHVVIQQPDARLPGAVAAKLGFAEGALSAGLVSRYLGDLGAASSLVGLAAALDVAARDDRILVVSYGSGAGSDALAFRVVGDRRSAVGVRSESDRKEYVDYVQYAKLRRGLR